MPRQPTATHSIETAAAESVGRGVLAGLIPLVGLVTIAAIALGLTALSRLVTAAHGFFLQQQVAVIVLAAGLLAAVASYIAGCVGALRRVGAWRRAGETAAVSGALWALGATALLVLLPAILAVVLPQHPAP